MPELAPLTSPTISCILRRHFEVLLRFWKKPCYLPRVEDQFCQTICTYQSLCWHLHRVLLHLWESCTQREAVGCWGMWQELAALLSLGLLPGEVYQSWHILGYSNGPWGMDLELRELIIRKKVKKRKKSPQWIQSPTTDGGPSCLPSFGCQSLNDFLVLLVFLGFSFFSYSKKLRKIPHCLKYQWIHAKGWVPKLSKGHTNSSDSVQVSPPILILQLFEWKFRLVKVNGLPKVVKQ